MPHALLDIKSLHVTYYMADMIFHKVFELLMSILISRKHDSVANSHALSFDPGLSEFTAKMFKELKFTATRC
jgi:hypothetical protein